MVRKTKPQINVDADIVWAAACKANEINNGYIKYVTPEEIKEGKSSNRMIVDRLIQEPNQIEERFYQDAGKVRNYYKAFTFKILQGIKLNDFNNNAMVIANRDTIDSTFDIAVITCLPLSYQNQKVRDDADNRVRFASGGFLASVGSKVAIDIEVLKSVYSHNYGVYFVTGVTENDQPVFFSYKSGINTGKKIKVSGTVKAHRDNSTQLNRVKVLS
jgi:hypothetical protein